jgi:hypothetical protein
MSKMKTAESDAGRVLVPCYVLQIHKWYASGEDAPEKFKQGYGFVEIDPDDADEVIEAVRQAVAPYRRTAVVE